MLHLYKNIQPNNANIHYLFSTLAQFKTELSSYLVESVTLDSYRINSNVIKVKIDTTLTETLADQLTYAIQEETNYFRCWHVNSVIFQSGFVILYCSLDDWANYISKANLSDINVVKCNRNVGVGLLENLAGTKGAPVKSYIPITNVTSGTNNELFDISKVYIVFALKYNNYQNTYGAVSSIKLCAFNLKTLRQAFYTGVGGGLGASIYQPLDIAREVVGGIYGVVGYNTWGTATANAVVLNAWLTDVVVGVESLDIKIKSKTPFDNWNDITLPVLEVVPYVTEKTLTIANDFNKQLYVGTIHNGLKLQRTTEANISVTIRSIPSTDHLTILACQGDNQVDISDAFKLTLGTTDGDVTALRQGLGILQTATAGISSAIVLGKGIQAGMNSGQIGAGEFAMAMGVSNMGTMLANDLGTIRSSHIGGLLSGGDGYLAYWRLYTGDPSAVDPTTNLSTPITNPYIITAYTSIDDEKVSARMYGARYNEKVASLASIFSSSLIGTGTNTDATYVQCGCRCDGVPQNACDHIRHTLLNGVYLKNLITS